MIKLLLFFSSRIISIAVEIMVKALGGGYVRRQSRDGGHVIGLGSDNIDERDDSGLAHSFQGLLSIRIMMSRTGSVVT